MEYKNIKTGAVIDSLSVIIGEVWELVEKEQEVELETEVAVEVEKPETKKEPRKTKE